MKTYYEGTPEQIAALKAITPEQLVAHRLFCLDQKIGEISGKLKRARCPKKIAIWRHDLGQYMRSRRYYEAEQRGEDKAACLHAYWDTVFIA